MNRADAKAAAARMAQAEEAEAKWLSLTMDERTRLIQEARTIQNRSVAWIGPHRMYEHWLVNTRTEALDGDFDAYLLLCREFYCSRPDRLRGVRLTSVVLHESYDHRLWRHGDLDHAIGVAKACGTWRGR